MHSKPKNTTKSILLFLHYAAALLATLGIGESLFWLILTLVNFALFFLISKHSQTLRKHELFLTFFLMTISLFFVTVLPAYAQFFGPAEMFIKTCFSTATALVSLVFNILRLLLLLYLGVSLVQGINAVRDGQNLIAVATPPILVLVIVTAADVASNLIIGGATC